MSMFSNWIKNPVKETVNFFEDTVEDVVDVVKDIGDFVQDDILIPVTEGFEDIYKAIEDDPVRSIIYIGAAVVSTIPGFWWVYPAVVAADTKESGGTVEESLTAGAKAAATQYVTQGIASGVSSYTEAAVLGDAFAPTASAISTAETIGTIAAGAAVGATGAIILGEDPLEAAIMGGAQAGLSAAMGKVRTNVAEYTASQNLDLSDELAVSGQPLSADYEMPIIPKAVLSVVEAQLSHTLSGGDGTVSDAIIQQAILRATVTTATMQTYLNTIDYQPSDAQLAALTNGVIQTTTVALQGGDVSGTAVKNIINYTALTLKENFKDIAKTTIDKVRGTYEDVEKKAGEYDFVAAEHEAVQTDYNNAMTEGNEAKAKYDALRAEIEPRFAERDRLKVNMDAAKAAFEASPANAAREAANTNYNNAIKAYNNYASQLDTDYSTNYKPALEKYLNITDNAYKQAQDYIPQLNDLTDRRTELGEEYKELEATLIQDSGNLDEALKPTYVATNQAFVKAMTNDTFNEEEYAKLNGLEDAGETGEEIDPYYHWLTTGKEERLPTNAADYNAQVEQEKQNLILQSVKAAGLDLSTIGKDGLKELQNKIESTYGFNLDGLKKADPIVLGNDVAKFYLDEALKPNPEDSIDEAFAREKFNEKAADISSITFEEIKELVGDPELQLISKTSANTIENTLNIPQTDIARGNATINIDSDGNLTWKQITSTAPYWNKEKNLLVRDEWDFFSGKYFPVEHTTGQQLYNSYNEVGDIIDYGFGMGPDSADSASINAFVGVDDYKEYETPGLTQEGVGISNIVSYDPTTLNDLIDSGSTLWVETAANLDEASAAILDSKYVTGMTAAAKSVYEYAKSVITLDPKNSKLLKEAASILPAASGKTIDLFSSIGQFGNEMSAIITSGIGATIASGDADALGQAIGGNKDFGRSKRLDDLVNDLAGYTSNLQSEEFKTINNDFDKKYEEAEGFWETTNVIYDGVKNNPWEIIVGKVAPEALIAAFGTKGVNFIKGGGKLIATDISKNLVNKGAPKTVADKTSKLMSEAYDKTFGSLSNKVATGASTLTENQIRNTSILAAGAALTAEATNQLQNIDYSNNDSNLSWWENIWGTPVSQQLSQVGARDTEVAVDEYTEYEVYKYETPEIKKVIEKDNPTFASSAQFSDFFNLGLPETSDTSKIQTGSASGNLIANYNPQINNILTEAINNPELVPFALTQLEDLDLPQETKTNLFNFIAPTEYQTKKDIQNKFIESPTPYKPSTADIDAFVGNKTNEEVTGQLQDYIDQRYFTADDAINFAAEQGFTLDRDEAITYAKQINDDTAKENLNSAFDIRGTSQEEAEYFFESIGYDNPTQTEIDQFTQNITEADSQQNITEYAALNTTTQQEAEKALTDAGFDVSLLPAEFISSFVKQGLQTETEANLLNEAEKYRIDENEARLAFEKAGLPDVTQEDISKLIGQYDESLLAEKITEALPTAQYNSLRNVIAGNQETGAKQIGDLGALISGQETKVDAVTELLTGQGIKVDAVTELLTGQGTKVDTLTDLVGAPANVNTGDVATGLYSNIANLNTNYNNRIDETQAFIDQQFKTQADAEAEKVEEARKASVAKAAKDKQMGDAEQIYAMTRPRTGSVKEVELANIGNPYDFQSIFRDAAQESFYQTPYGKGGQVDNINDRLLKLIGGN